MAAPTRKRVNTAPDIAAEEVMSWIWQRQYLRPGLKTTDGEPVRVVFPGRRNGLGGPDFRRAILVAGRKEVRGDVELHLRSSLWRAHGHHLDPAYDSVVLHVVMWDDTRCPVWLHSGRAIPTLSLGPHVLGKREVQLQPGQERREPPAAAGKGALEAVLDGLGELRFLAKAGRFQAGLCREGAGQVLYEGVMVALGYSRNEDAFKELARRLPLAEAEAAVREGGQEAIRNLALARSGLVASAMPASSAIAWRRQGVRPGNQPARRIEALCHLLCRYDRAGWLEGLMGAVRMAADGDKGGRRELEAALAVAAGCEGSGTDRVALLGRGKAGEIAVNVLLPFAYAYGMTGPALELYRGYAPLEDNEITREMSAQLGLAPRVVNSARRQQGLIHLFKAFCLERNCGCCPLGDLSFLCSGCVLPVDRGEHFKRARA